MGKERTLLWAAIVIIAVVVVQQQLQQPAPPQTDDSAATAAGIGSQDRFLEYYWSEMGRGVNTTLFYNGTLITTSDLDRSCKEKTLSVGEIDDIKDMILKQRITEIRLPGDDPGLICDGGS